MVPRDIKNVHNTFCPCQEHHVLKKIKSNGISDKTAKMSIRKKYFCLLCVCIYPSTIKKEKIGKANRPKKLIQTCPTGKIVFFI